MSAKYPGYAHYVDAINQAFLAYGVITGLVAGAVVWMLHARSLGKRWHKIARIGAVLAFYAFAVALWFAS